ncbi:MAG: PKD domain-containing protein, partial [Bacteroidia bacterium]
GSFTYTPDATGNGVTFNGSSTGTGSAYAWDFGDGLTSTLQNPHHVFGANGTFHVCMTVSSPTDSTCSSTTCQNVTVSGLCSANFYVTMDSLAFDSTYFIYSYASGSGTISYLWDFGDGSTSTLAYPTHTYATSGPFYICLTVSDGIGCSDTHCDSIGTGHALSHPITLYVLNATGIQEQTNIISSLENYPNPFNDNTTISYSIKKDAMVELSILDLLGNKIATIEKGNRATGGYSINWNSEGVAEGLYLLQLKVDNNISTKKLVISK